MRFSKLKPVYPSHTTAFGHLNESNMKIVVCLLELDGRHDLFYIELKSFNINNSTYQTGWLSELSVRLPFWEIADASLIGQVKLMT